MIPQVKKAIDLMESHAGDSLPLSEIARSVGWSVWHLSHVFKRETGQSPMQYLKALRLQRARLLLTTSRLSVKAVAFQVGIGDHSHFARYFKNLYGVTPTKYRQQKWAA